MKNAPLVSIIVPVHNVRDYLDVCVKSLLDQTYKNLEIILVDDGSTDGSEKIADKYSKKYKYISVIHKKNGGLSSARNAGVKSANGEWLMFVDSDDYVKNNYVSELVKLVLKNEADIATCSFEPFTDDGSMLKKVPTWPNKILSGEDAVNDMLKNKRPAYIWLNIFSAKLFKKNKIEFPDGHDYEDIATKIKLLYYARKVAFTNDKLYFYLIRKNGITGKDFTEKRCKDFLKAINDSRKFLKKSEYLDYFEYYSLVTLLNYLARENNLSLGVKKYWAEVRSKLKTLYGRTKFPNLKIKIFYGSALVISSNRIVYSRLYRGIKK